MLKMPHGAPKAHLGGKGYTRYSWAGGTNDRQMTPRGYPYYDSYMKNLCVLVFRTDGDINLVWASLITFLQVHPLCVGWRNTMVRSISRVLFRIPDRWTDRQTDGDANFNSYVQNLCVFVFQTDRQADR